MKSSLIIAHVTFVLSLYICKWNSEILYVCIISWVSSSFKIFPEFLKKNYCLNTKRFILTDWLKSKVSKSLFTEISSGRTIYQCFVASLGFWGWQNVDNCIPKLPLVEYADILNEVKLVPESFMTLSTALLLVWVISLVHLQSTIRVTDWFELEETLKVV